MRHPFPSLCCVHFSAILLGLLMVACASQKSEQNHFRSLVTDDRVAEFSEAELDVLEELIRSQHPLHPRTTLIVEEFTSTGGLVDSLPEKGNAHVSAETVREFKRLNQNRVKLPESLSRRLPIHYFTEHEAKINWERGGWGEFHRLYPFSHGIITISRPGFSPDGNTAIVYHGWVANGLEGAGRIFVLRREGGRWKVTSIRIGAGWVA